MNDSPQKTRGRKRMLSEHHLYELADLREKGLSYNQIAEYFSSIGINITLGCMQWQCLRLGASKPTPIFREPRTDPSYSRAGRTVRRFTPDEDAKLLGLEASGATYREMSEALRRKESSLRGRLMTLGRRDAYLDDKSTI